MRIWHWALLPWLPEKQFRGQLRELVAIMHDWRDKGSTNHLLINRAMDYGKAELCFYFQLYAQVYEKRLGKALARKYLEEFAAFGAPERPRYGFPYEEWHNKEYLRICMANLFEKRHFGRGKSRITAQEWRLLEQGYREHTGEEYQI